MNRYDLEYDRWIRGGGWTERGAYGGLRSDADPEGAAWRRTRGEFGWGGGMYDIDYPRRSRRQRRTAEAAPAPSARPSERMTVREIMTPDPDCVMGESSLAEAAQRMATRDVGVIPVVENRETAKLVGVITDRDITIRGVATGADPNARVSDYMTRDIRTAHPDSPLRQVIETMRGERVRRIPVTDSSGRLVGIISQADLAVDYAGFERDREIEVEEMIERISEPAHPRAVGAEPEPKAVRRSRIRGAFDYW